MSATEIPATPDDDRADGPPAAEVPVAQEAPAPADGDAGTEVAATAADVAPVDEAVPAPVAEAVPSAVAEVVPDAPATRPSASAAPPKRRKVRKRVPASREASFVFITVDDVGGRYVPVTAGEPCPYPNPRWATSLRVLKSAVVFSTVQVTKALKPRFVEQPIEVPHAALTRLSRHATTFNGILDDDEIAVEIDEATHTLRYAIDDNGVVRISEDGAPEIELGRRSLRLSIYLRSTRANRMLAVGYIGYLGKPDTTDTLDRVVGRLLNSQLKLADFKQLTGFEAVDLPAPVRGGGGGNTRSRGRGIPDTLEFTIPAVLFDDAATPQPIRTGELAVTVSLTAADPMTGKVLVTAEADEAIGATFEGYRQQFAQAVATAMHRHMGEDELRDVTTSIVLGEVDDSILTRINDALSAVERLHLAPSRYEVVFGDVGPAA